MAAGLIKFVEKLEYHEFFKVNVNKFHFFRHNKFIHCKPSENIK